MTNRFEDHRGFIQDLITQPLDSVTEIFTKAGAVRGNHTHHETTQWTYIVSGRLRAVARYPDGDLGDGIYVPGTLLVDNPGTAHAWQAVEDTLVIVFTRGPRSGANYEDDVQRLTGDERLIIP